MDLEDLDDLMVPPTFLELPAANPNVNPLFGYNRCGKGLFKMTYGAKDKKIIKNIKEFYEFRKHISRAYDNDKLNTDHIKWQYKSDLRLLDDLMKRLKDKYHRQSSPSLLEAAITIIRERMKILFIYMNTYQWVIEEELHMLLEEIRTRHLEFINFKREIKEATRKREEEGEEEDEEEEEMSE